MEYLTKEQILLIHSMVVDETGGSHGVRDNHAILSLEKAPAQEVFGKELYPTIFLKAAVYARTIIMSHPFLDGNKRTAMSVALIFLENNSYSIVLERGQLVEFALKIVLQKLDIEAIAHWFEKHSRENRDQ